MLEQRFIPPRQSNIHEPTTFSHRGAFGDVMLFDATLEACSVFGLEHGQQIRARRGIDAGKCFVVIGVCMGSLWVLPDGKQRCTVLAHCTSASDVIQRYDFEVLGTIVIPEVTEADLHASPKSQSTARDSNAEDTMTDVYEHEVRSQHSPSRRGSEDSSAKEGRYSSMRQKLVTQTVEFSMVQQQLRAKEQAFNELQAKAEELERDNNRMMRWIADHEKRCTSVDHALTKHKSDMESVEALRRDLDVHRARRSALELRLLKEERSREVLEKELQQKTEELRAAKASHAEYLTADQTRHAVLEHRMMEAARKAYMQKVSEHELARTRQNEIIQTLENRLQAQDVELLRLSQIVAQSQQQLRGCCGGRR
jgi:hypothetical protein